MPIMLAWHYTSSQSISMDLYSEIMQANQMIEHRPELFKELAKTIKQKLPVKSLSEDMLAYSCSYEFTDGLDISITLLNSPAVDEGSADKFEVEIREISPDEIVEGATITRTRYFTLDSQLFEATYEESCARIMDDLSDVNMITKPDYYNCLYSSQAAEILLLLERIPDY